MSTKLIEDRGPDSRIVGTRLTVLDLLPHLLEAELTEAAIGDLFDLTLDRVAAARAFILRHPDIMLVGYQEAESRPAPQNSPEVIARAKKNHTSLLSFREWMIERDRGGLQADAAGDSDSTRGRHFPTFKEWLAERDSPIRAES